MKKILILLSFLCVLGTSNKSIAQPINNLVQDVVLPPPNAAALGKYGDIPVNYATGTPNISVPIHTITEGALSLSIGLNYHSGGIKLGEVASWVGSGWSLDAGGMISRTVLGIPDEHPRGYWDNSASIDTSDRFNICEILNGERDGEADLYSLNVAGFSGKFFFDGQHNIHIIPQHLDLKIDYTIAFNNVIESFTVIPPNGNKYIFGKTTDGTTAYESMSAGQNVPAWRSSWMLLRIESFDGVNAINLSYNEEQYTYKNLASCKYTLGNFPGVSTGVFCPGSNGPDLEGNEFVFQSVNGKRLRKISSNTESLDFLGNTLREDVNNNGSSMGARRLDQIVISSGISPYFCSRFDFSYDYFEDLSGTHNFPYYKRLQLKKVQEFSCTDITDFKGAYEFDYEGPTQNGTPILPHRLSKRIDHWGYHNGASQNDNLEVNVPSTSLRLPLSPTGASTTYGAADRDSYENFMMHGTLNKITYPTGGTTFFVFEGNQAAVNQLQEKIPLIQNLASSCTPPNCCGFLTNTATETFTSLEQIQNAYFDLEVTGTPSGCTSSFIGVRVSVYRNGVFLGTYELNTGSDASGGVFNKPLSDFGITFEAGVAYSFSLLSANGRGVFNLYSQGYELEALGVGGLRIQQITHNDESASTNNDIVKTFTYPDLNNASLPSGKLMNMPIYGVSGTLTAYTLPTSFYAIFSANSQVPLGEYDGRHLLYQQVIEHHNGNGKIVYVYEVDQSQTFRPIYGPASGANGSVYGPTMPKLFKTNHGQLKTKTSYNEAGQEVAKTTLTFPTPTYKTAAGKFVKVAGLACAPGSLSYYGYSTYNPRTDAFLMSSQKNATDGVTITTTYEYDETSPDVRRGHAPIAVHTLNSNGKTYTNKTKYAYHFTDAVHTELVNQNRIAMPIEQSKEVDGLQVDGSRTNCSFFTSGGNPTSTGGLNRIYPHEFERYEMTWKENGDTDVPGWELQGEILEYDMTVGKPKRFKRNGSTEENYTWDTNNYAITSREFEDFKWTYRYYPDTRFLSSITDIDSQVDSFRYDNFRRLSLAYDRAGMVTTTYDYSYKSNTNANNFVHTNTSYATADNSALSTVEVFQYLDGLGRPIQTVQKKHSGEQKDVVRATTYDHQGRPSKQYEPFEKNTSDGSFIALTSYASNDHRLITYEMSPLNRQISLKAPEWYTTHIEYGTNEASITIPGGDTYQANELFTQTTIEPDDSNTQTGDRTINFSNKRGQVVLSRKLNATGTLKNDTYTLYDGKDRPSHILPPGVSYGNALQYYYLYDGADNIIEKKIPDQEVMEYIYDNRDLLVAHRDGLLRSDGKWMVSVYDAYGRVTQTGLVAQTAALSPINLLPTEVWTKTFYDGQVGATLPTQRNIYNDLPQDLQGLFPPAARNVPAPADRTNIAIYKGKVHYTETATLNGNTASPAHKRLFTTYAYDQFGRIMHLGEDNHLGGYDLTAFFYNHQDNVTRTLRSHRFDHDNSPDFSNYVNNHYDHQGRDIAQYFNILGHNSHQICGKTYTAKDQIASKSLGKTATGFLQEVNYDYLPNGFLSGINTETTDPADLFHLDINYHQPSSFGTSAPSQYNGNISQLTWWGTNTNNKQSYGYTYDYLDRLTRAKYGTLNLSNQLNPTGDYDTNYAYDERGNIIELDRTGMVSVNNVLMKQDMDKLRFTPVPNSNQIATIIDASTGSDSGLPPVLNVPGAINSDSYEATVSIISNGQTIDNSDVTFRAGQDITLTPGFETKGEFLAIIQAPSNPAGFAQTSEDSYLYDENGNMIRDPNKGIDIAYNYLNLPYQVTYDNGNKIEWLYDANGKKWQKQTSGTETVKQDYLNDVEYKGGVLEAIYLEDARVVFDNGSFDGFQYFLPDHLGNNRVVFKDSGNGQAEVVQESHFYPFGLEMEGGGAQNNGRENKYLYNGKELDTDFGLNWYHYGARMYDSAIGRFTGVDPISDRFAWVSTYNYAENEPIANIDLWGLQKHRMVDGSTVTGPVSPEVLNQTNEEIVTEQITTNNEGKDMTDLGLAEVISTNAAQGEGMMQIFSPDNVGTILMLAQGTGANRVAKSFAPDFSKVVLSRSSRLSAFKNGLKNADAVSNPDEAIGLINKTLNKVEDLYSGVKRNPNIATAPNRNDGRMYGILDDTFVTRHSSGNVTALTKGHRIELQPNGGFEIFNRRSGEVFLSKLKKP